MSTLNWVELKEWLEIRLSRATEQDLLDDETVVRICEAFSNAKISGSEKIEVDFRLLLDGLEHFLSDPSQLPTLMNILDRLRPR